VKERVRVILYQLAKQYEQRALLEERLRMSGEGERPVELLEQWNQLESALTEQAESWLNELNPLNPLNPFNPLNRLPSSMNRTMWN